jgi:GT2 family glycosyltransferase
MAASSRRSRALRAGLSRLRGASSAPAGAPPREEGDPDVELLVGSALFDDDWYRLCLGRALRRRRAVRHYLEVGRARGLTPHPLFDPDFVASQKGVARDADPLVTYLRQRSFALEVHPLLDVAGYVEANPEALEHPDGPLGHYGEHGAPAGLRVNDWYVPDPATQPRGLVDWLEDDARQWYARQQVSLPAWGRGRAPEVADASLGPVTDSRLGTTTVVLVAEQDGQEVRRSVASVLAQTCPDWTLLVLSVEGGVDPRALDLPADSRIVVGDVRHPGVWAARNHALRVAEDGHVAYMVAGDEWLAGRLSSVRRALLDSGSSWVTDCARDEHPGATRRHATRPVSRERLLAGVGTELGTLVATTAVLGSVGGFEESLPSGHVLDLMLRLSEREEPGFAPRLGVSLDRDARRANRRVPATRRPWVDRGDLVSANDEVLNEHLVDWPALGLRETSDDLVSVLVPTNGDWELTSAAVRSVVAAREPGAGCEVIVIDNGSGLVTSAVLASLAEELEDVRVLRSPVNRGFALGNNIALPEARGATVVFLNNDTEVRPGWLGPLLEALRDEAVLGAQSLLLYPTGAVQSAGVVFPRGGGIPHMLLNGFHPRDADGIETYGFRALTGAALALRHADAVSLRGFDPVFRNGMEDVDLCLRLAELRPGRFVVRPDSVVLHHESRAPGRGANALVNRRVLLDRWAGRLPEDDVEAWSQRGYDVHGHEVRVPTGPDRRLHTAQPVLTRRPRAGVVEGLPALRWAVKISSPFGPKGEAWGDTHFARQLGAALGELGQDVVIDHPGEFHRASAHHDDVVLLLRGLAPYTPVVDQVNLTWLISHPDLVAPSDHVGWDRVYVASTPYAEQLAASGAPAVPLLQATDPSLFHPDLAPPDTGHRVLFVGNSRGQARPLVMAAVDCGLPLSVFGAGWDGFLPPELLRGTYLPNEQVGAAYRSAGVVLNDHWEDMSANGFLSNRLFDAVAAGARVVSDEVAGLREVFGDAVQVARTPGELAALVNRPDLDSVFGSDEVRRDRAHRVAAEHSFAARARVLVEDAARIRAGRGLA